MRQFISIVESAQNFDPDYYMSEGCGIFAYALWLAHGKPTHGEIGIISRGDGEPWSEEIPFEVTHAFFEIGDKCIDVRGIRSMQDMSEELYIADDWGYQGSWLPDQFLQEFMGQTDQFPLYVGQQGINDALVHINNNKQFYGGAITILDMELCRLGLLPNTKPQRKTS